MSHNPFGPGSKADGPWRVIGSSWETARISHRAEGASLVKSQRQTVQKWAADLTQSYNWFVDNRIDQKLPSELRGVDIKELESRVQRASYDADWWSSGSGGNDLALLWWGEEYYRLPYGAYGGLQKKILELRLPGIGKRAAMDIASMIISLTAKDELDRFITDSQGVYDECRAMLDGRVSLYHGKVVLVRLIAKPAFRVFLAWWADNINE